MQVVWAPRRGLACAITDVFCFLQSCGFWCDLLENDDTSQPLLPNYIFWLILVFYLFMLNWQAVLGQFIVVSTEKRWAEHARWHHRVLHICIWEGTIHSCIRPWVMGPAGSTQHSTGDLAGREVLLTLLWRSVGQAVRWLFRDSLWPSGSLFAQIFF